MSFLNSVRNNFTNKITRDGDDSAPAPTVIVTEAAPQALVKPESAEKPKPYRYKPSVALDIEPQGVKRVFEDSMEARRYLNVNGLMGIGIAALMLPTLYADERLLAMLPGVAFGGQAAIDAKKRIPHNPAAFELLKHTRDESNWELGPDGFRFAKTESDGIVYLEPGEDPIMTMSSLVEDMLGRSLKSMRAWHNSDKAWRPFEFAPVAMQLPYQPADPAMGIPAARAVDFSDSPLHNMHNWAYQWWVSYGIKQLAAPVMPIGMDKAKIEEAIAHFFNGDPRRAACAPQELHLFNAIGMENVLGREEAWRTTGIRLIEAIIKRNDLGEVQTCSKQEYLKWRNSSRLHPLQKHYAMMADARRLKQADARGHAPKNVDIEKDMREDLNNSISRTAMLHARQMIEDRAKTNRRAAIIELITIIHYELVEQYEEEYRNNKVMSKPELAMRVLCYERGLLFRLLGIDLEVTCPFMDENIDRIEGLVREITLPSHLKDIPNDHPNCDELRRERAIYYKEYKKHHNALARLQYIIRDGGELSAAHFAQHGCLLTSCPDCMTKIDDEMVKQIRRYGTNRHTTTDRTFEQDVMAALKGNVNYMREIYIQGRATSLAVQAMKEQGLSGEATRMQLEDAAIQSLRAM